MHHVHTWQRVCLVFIPALALLWWPPTPFFENMWFIYVLLALETLVIVMNWPQLVTFFHSKPLYVSDLEDHYSLTVVERRKYQVLFLRLQQAVTVLCIPIVIQYYLDRYSHFHSKNWLENLAVAYAALNLITTITSKIGSVLLNIVFYCKRVRYRYSFPDTPV